MVIVAQEVAMGSAALQHQSEVPASNYCFFGPAREARGLHPGRATADSV